MGAYSPAQQARRDSNPQPPVLETGALPVELRTSVVARPPRQSVLQWPGAESNHRHRDFQSRALPTELPGRQKNRPGLSATDGLTRGARSKFLAAPPDRPRSQARPRIGHRPTTSLLGIRLEHRPTPPKAEWPARGNAARRRRCQRVAGAGFEPATFGL